MAPKSQPGVLADLWDSRDRFAPDRLSELPAAARRYLEHAIAPGTVLASSVKLQMHGEIKLNRWHRFTAEQVMHRSHEFIWRAATHFSGIPVRGFNRLIAGKAATRWKLFGFLPVIASSGPMTSRSAAGRAVAESVWFPSTLCSKNVRWTALSERRVHAHLAAQGEWAELALRIGDNGELKRLSLLRWSSEGQGEYHYLPFGGIVEEEDTFRGYTIPTRMRFGYYPGTDRFETEGEFIRITIDQATFL